MRNATCTATGPCGVARALDSRGARDESEDDDSMDGAGGDSMKRIRFTVEPKGDDWVVRQGQHVNKPARLIADRGYDSGGRGGGSGSGALI